MGALETVKVKHEDGFMIINKTSFDAEKHELFEAPADVVDTTDFGGGEEMTMEKALLTLAWDKEGDFTASGLPRVARVEELLGHDVTADEVKAAWNALALQGEKD